MLDNHVCIGDIPVLTASPADRDESGRTTRPALDRARLDLLAENGNRAIGRGDAPAVLLGHTVDPTEDRPHPQHPPAVGQVNRFRVADGNDTLLADMCIRTEFADVAGTYPRRSAEVYSGDRPSDHIIGAVCLLRRAPRLDLGVMDSRAWREAHAGAIPSAAPARNARRGRPDRYTRYFPPATPTLRQSPTPRRPNAMRTTSMTRKPDRYARDAADMFITEATRPDIAPDDPRFDARSDRKYGRALARYCAETGKSYEQGTKDLNAAIGQLNPAAPTVDEAINNMSNAEWRKVVRYSDTHPGVHLREIVGGMLSGEIELD